jgi:hypothetical protein
MTETKGDATREYEWGVGHRRIPGPHCAGMTEARARKWVADMENRGFRPGTFFVIRRPKGGWEEA